MRKNKFNSTKSIWFCVWFVWIPSATVCFANSIGNQRTQSEQKVNMETKDHSKPTTPSHNHHHHHEDVIKVSRSQLSHLFWFEHFSFNFDLNFTTLLKLCYPSYNHKTIPLKYYYLIFCRRNYSIHLEGFGGGATKSLHLERTKNVLLKV